MHAYLPWLTEAEYRAHAGAARAYDHPISALRRILIETRLYGGMAESLLAADADRGSGAPDPPDLTLLYLQGTDSIGHVFAPFAPPRQPTIPERDFERYRDVPERYFREVDGLLGRLLALADRAQASVVVASDHGFLWNEGRPERWASSATQTAARWHRQPGHLAGARRGSRPRARRERPPASGLPHPPGARRAAGRRGHRNHGRSARSRLPATPAFDYGRRLPRARRAPRGFADSVHRDSHGQWTQRGTRRQEEIAKLQALGYIGASEAMRANPTALAAGGPDATRTASSWNNDGLVLRGEHREAEARAAFEGALELEPGLASALWNLSELLFAAGEVDRADELLVRALAGGLPDGTAAGHRPGDRVRARGVDSRGVSRCSTEPSPSAPERPTSGSFAGAIALQSGDCGNALSDLARAGELAPTHSDVFATTALAQLCAGDRAAALAALRRALELAPDEPRLRALLAEVQRAP